jgi:hypothetical protein
MTFTTTLKNEISSLEGKLKDVTIKSIRKGFLYVSLGSILFLSACGALQPEGYNEYNVSCDANDPKIIEVQEQYKINLEIKFPSDFPKDSACVLTVRTINNDKNHTPMYPYFTLTQDVRPLSSNTYQGIDFIKH